MAKVSISNFEKAQIVDVPPKFSGSDETQIFFKDGKAPIQLYLNRLAPGGAMHLSPGETHAMTYVWEGEVEVAGERLGRGSSFIVERGASADVSNHGADARLLTFMSDKPSRGKAAGHVHLLPTASVPREEDFGHEQTYGGGMHCDATTPTEELWLHESILPPENPQAPIDPESQIHSHTEDEVIVVTAGEMRLGGRLYGPGTALAVAANTFYGFTVGPAGLKFINFRAGRPGDIILPNGNRLDEVGMWQTALPTPKHISFETKAAPAMAG